MASGRRVEVRGLAVVMIVLFGVVAAMPGGLFAQSKTQREGPVIRGATIEEADLSDGVSPDAASRGAQEAVGSTRDRPPFEELRDESAENAEADTMPAEGKGVGGLPLLAKVTDKTTPQRAASLKLIEEGQEFLEAGEYKQALGAFERAIAVDATNPYSHYFVARAHFFLGNYQESFNFLDVAESLLGWHKRWLAEIHVLKGRNATAMGFLGRADTNYLEALDLNPYNRFALERLTTIDETLGRQVPAP